MSSLRAIDVPTQRIDPLPAHETEAYLRPRRRASAVPVWAQRTEETIRILARLGSSPTPTILLVSAIAVSATLHTH